MTSCHGDGNLLSCLPCFSAPHPFPVGRAYHYFKGKIRSWSSLFLHGSAPPESPPFPPLPPYRGALNVRTDLSLLCSRPGTVPCLTQHISTKAHVCPVPELGALRGQLVSPSDPVSCPSPLPTAFQPHGSSCYLSLTSHPLLP